MKLLKRGDKVTYEKDYNFGKTGFVVASVIMVRGGMALLNNGDQITAIARS